MSDRERAKIAQESVPVIEGAGWTETPMGDRLRAAYAGHIEPAAPTVGALPGGARALFYPGKVSGIAGDSGSGKSWLALAAALAEARGGRPTIWVDYEDNADTLAVRMAELGWPVELGDHVRHVQAVGAASGGFALLCEGIVSMNPAMVVLDSTGESLAGDGRNPNADDDVAAWFQSLPRPLADRGPAVVLLDHLVKDSDNGGLWPSGSQRKRAAINGIQYIVKPDKPFSREQPGHITLICAKDRGGRYAQGDHVAVVHFEPSAGVLHITATAGGTGVDRKVERPTRLMESVSRVLEASPEGLSGRGIEDALSDAGVKFTKGQPSRWAARRLVEEGYVSTSPGPRNSTIHMSVRPYREDADSLDQYGDERAAA